jgi:hypothetical protein
MREKKSEVILELQHLGLPQCLSVDVKKVTEYFVAQNFVFIQYF